MLRKRRSRPGPTCLDEDYCDDCVDDSIIAPTAVCHSPCTCPCGASAGLMHALHGAIADLDCHVGPVSADPHRTEEWPSLGS